MSSTSGAIRCWADRGHVARPAWGSRGRGSIPAGRATFGGGGSYSRASGLDEVFELKQRLVEAEVKRQAAEKAAAESQRVRQELQRRLTQTRWLLAAVLAVLLLAVGALAWAELEAPPLGTMSLGAQDSLPGLTALSVAMQRAVAWVQALAGSLWRKGGAF
ncbi:hypothetical protein PLESTB_000146300 [Pleodorina starrii]|uniref:Uncharacterized protein n=1 Tax=Pleodorina starrii TaxID=330485 RepID=A0A9W6BBS1_9CHLO|nr:hypothetical protein PLESTB_000146300 [Pleodorina starrii]